MRPVSMMAEQVGKEAHLHPNMLKIHPQLLQQRRLPVVPLCPERGKPTRSQSRRVGAHPPADPC